VTPYSLRAKDGAPAACPIDWDEVDDADLTPTRYTMKDLPGVVTERGDRWKGMRKRAKSLTKPAEKLARLAAG
jgi:bifunctional non-homologous end joining protein LigD